MMHRARRASTDGMDAPDKRTYTADVSLFTSVRFHQSINHYFFVRVLNGVLTLRPNLLSGLLTNSAHVPRQLTKRRAS